ncbi:MAG: T9SS type A sorting domain-containing protein [Crocinitomicaceae bacterium]|nr:MAG: T9SS type A sorting domain-containing protein [Crocinitomicaceae bacterium]
MKKTKVLLFGILSIACVSHGQEWHYNALNQGVNGNNLGTSDNFPINIYTNSIQRARFTTGTALTSPWDAYAPIDPTGDGLRILGSGNLDLFTGLNSTTHIKFGGSGAISGQNSRMEYFAAGAGFYMDAVNGGFFKFARAGVVTCRVGSNNFWRIGQQSDLNNLDAQRRLHVVDNTTQFRLSYAPPGSNGGVFTDFLSNSGGNLQIQPSGQRVGINAPSNPTATIDVFGDARIRNVQAATPNSILVGVNAAGSSDVNVRRLDFPNDPTQVLLGNGTWGAALPNITANNGMTLVSGTIIQIGESYNGPTTSPLLNNREVRLNNRHFIFSKSGAANSGKVGIGQVFPSMPTEQLDVDGNIRVRNVPSTNAEYIITGKQVGANNNDVVLRKTAFPNDPTQVLLGNGTWGSIPGQFGAACTDPLNGNLNYNTKVNMNDYNLYFTNNNALNQNHVGIGIDCGLNLPGKLSVVQNHPNSVNSATYSIYAKNNDVSNTAGTIQGVINGISNGVQPTSLFTMNQGAYLEATNSKFNLGVLSYANGTTVPVSNNTAGAFRATGGVVGIGVNATSVGATSNNFGILGSANGGVNSYGIYAAASGSTTTNAAGYFVGDVIANGNYLSSSDQQFKTNIAPVESALKIVSNLNPKSYYFDTVNYDQFNFGSEKQYGFIAQEVETSLPELVHNSVHPGVYDSIGNQIVPATTYKSLNYNAIIPINTQAIKELNVKVDKATLSDQTIKTNVQDLIGSLDKVLEMRGVTYEWNGTNHPNLQLDSVMHIGFIAQEINAIDPLLTFVDEDTLMHVEYDKVVPILAEAIQELNGQVVSQDSIIEVLTNENVAQQAQIEDLNDRLTQLENCLSGILPFLCQMNNSSIQPTQQEVQEQLASLLPSAERTAITVNLSNKNAIVLNQNVPNPFAESTTITYSVPSSVQKAQIHFYDGTGKLINTVDITEHGNGQLNVFANDLSSGVYTYSLIADGQVVSTKRMVKE